MNDQNQSLSHLNPEQQKAVLHKEGPLLILAGAGSGKTSTMTHRIAHLIRAEGVSPFQILAVTFTNKAAKEMKDRVEALIGDSSSIWILTFHSACLRILRSHAEKISYRPNFVVYDPVDQKTLIKSCLKEAGFDEKAYPPSYVLSIISDCKEKGISPSDFEAKNSDSPKTKHLARLFTAYDHALKANNAMDFDDLILRAVQLLETNSEILSYYQQKFQYIMVDEYQDTNRMQYRLIQLLASGHKNLCVVGDDDQCIYQWRGADINNILDFEKDFRGTKVIKLEQNYRSCANILAAAHSVIEHNSSRKAKKLWTTREKGEKVQYCRTADDREEARYIAMQIERLRSKGQSYRDMAILYRTNAQSRRFEEMFIAQGIQYRVLGGFRYYDRKEVKDMIAYMRLVQNPNDNLAFERVVNEPKRGVGDKTLEKLRVLARVRGESLFTTLSDSEILEGLSGKPKEAMAELIRILTSLIVEKEGMKLSDLYDALLAQTGYIRALEQTNTVEAESRIENLLEFKSAIYDYEKEKQDSGETGSLEEFMETIALMAEVDNHDETENAVTLMTLHSAKGLEFPVVFMPGMEDGLFPGFRSMDKPDGVEEERRLCYVGMTRAKERLYLTSAESRMLYGRTDWTRESIFLRELDQSLVEGDPIYRTKEFDRYSTKEKTHYEENKPFRPFSDLRVSGDELSPGDFVKHIKFGKGQVITIEGNTATVIFDSVGTKKLALDLAPLEKYTNELA